MTGTRDKGVVVETAVFYTSSSYRIRIDTLLLPSEIARPDLERVVIFPLPPNDARARLGDIVVLDLISPVCSSCGQQVIHDLLTRLPRWRLQESRVRNVELHRLGWAEQITLVAVGFPQGVRRGVSGVVVATSKESAAGAGGDVFARGLLQGYARCARSGPLLSLFRGEEIGAELRGCHLRTAHWTTVWEQGPGLCTLRGGFWGVGLCCGRSRLAILLP